MTITEKLIHDRIANAEQERVKALCVANHWGGRIDELKELLALMAQPVAEEPAK